MRSRVSRPWMKHLIPQSDPQRGGLTHFGQGEAWPLLPVEIGREQPPVCEIKALITGIASSKKMLRGSAYAAVLPCGSETCCGPISDTRLQEICAMARLISPR